MLSVIIPVYNAEKYISSCLESLLAYSGEELEVLVVDDGSKDGSGQICDEYRALYIYCDALLHTHLFKMFGIVSKITGFVKSYNREIDPQQYPGRFVKYATSRVLLLLWGVKRKIKQ